VSGWKLWPVCVVAAAGIVLGAAADPAPEHVELPRALGILQYLMGDWSEAVDEHGKLLSRVEFDEQLELFDDVLATLGAQPAPAARAIFQEGRRIRGRMIAQAPPGEVVPRLRDLHTRIVREFDVQLAPATVPALPVGRLVYESSCVACHGAAGDAETPIARTLEPRPRSFLAPEQEVRLSPYAIFAAVSWGIPGTAMPGFETLEEDERWSVAFYVAALRQGAMLREEDPQTLAPSPTAARSAISPRVPQPTAAAGVPRLTLHDLAFATDRDLLELLNGVPENLRREQLRRWRLDLPLEVGR
jgi:high-affinity iron transporter